MPAKKTTTKKTAKTAQSLALPVKVGKNRLYLDKADNGIRVGPKGRLEDPIDLALKLPKGERRRMRKALAKAGHRELVLSSIFPPQISQREYDRQREAASEKYRHRYGYNDHGDYGSHNA